MKKAKTLTGTVKTISAVAFEHGLGINLHTDWNTAGWTNTAYADTLFSTTGIKHYRDNPPPWQAISTQYQYLYTQYGAKAMFTVTTADGSGDLAAIEGFVSSYPGACELIEGINETSDTKANATAAQQALYNAVYANSTLTSAGIKVSSFTINSANPPSFYGSMAGMADYAGLHPYANSNAQYNGGVTAGIPWPNMNSMAAAVAAASPGMLQMMTEDGWCTVGGYYASAAEADIARYVLLAWCDAMYLGATRLYLYSGVNNVVNPTNPEDSFGLVDASGNALASAVAIGNLMGAAKDAGTAPNPVTQLSATVTGCDRELSLERSDDSFQLLLWNEAASTSTTVTLPAAVSAVRVFDPIKNTSTFVYNTASITLTVPNYPLLLNIAKTPAQVTASPDGTFISAVGQTLTDANGHVWGLSNGGTSGLQVVCDSVTDTSTSQVTGLVYFAKHVTQENSGGHAYTKVLPTDSWSQVW